MRVLGIDVGGTKLAAGIVDVATGEVSERRVWPTEPERGRRRRCWPTSCGARPSWRPTGSGSASASSSTSRAGRPARTRSTGATGILADAFAVPCTVESDVRAAALAEARFGAGRGRSSFLYVTISTGISHCLVIDGRPWAGRAATRS